jgi:hypothetical protein
MMVQREESITLGKGPQCSEFVTRDLPGAEAAGETIWRLRYSSKLAVLPFSKRITHYPGHAGRISIRFERFEGDK